MENRHFIKLSAAIFAALLLWSLVTSIFSRAIEYYAAKTAMEEITKMTESFKNEINDMNASLLMQSGNQMQENKKRIEEMERQAQITENNIMEKLRISKDNKKICDYWTDVEKKEGGEYNKRYKKLACDYYRKNL